MHTAIGAGSSAMDQMGNRKLTEPGKKALLTANIFDQENQQ
jgi:hypothetical protein